MVRFGHNNALSNREALHNISYFEGLLVFVGNHSLSSLTGLENVSSIGGSLAISYNNSLVSLIGLDNIDAGSINDLYIDDNLNLSTCDVLSICNYLAAPYGPVEIQNNATGCNSHEDVLDSCEANSVCNNEQLMDDMLLVYPNPSSGAMHLIYQISEKRKAKCDFFSIEGIRIRALFDETQQPGEHVITFDISDLPAGMYFVRMKIGLHAETVKIVKIDSRQ